MSLSQLPLQHRAKFRTKSSNTNKINNNFLSPVPPSLLTPNSKTETNAVNKRTIRIQQNQQKFVGPV